MELNIKVNLGNLVLSLSTAVIKSHTYYTYAVINTIGGLQ